jgi:hypothetical protein
MKLMLSFEGPLFKLRPLWAFIAGFLAASSSFSPAQFIILLFLVEFLMPAWWRYLEALFSADFQPFSPPGRRFLELPYTLPGSLAWRMAEGLGRFVSWWVEVFWPEQGKAFGAFLLLSVLAPTLALFHWSRLWPLLLLAGALGLAMVLSIKLGKDYSLLKAFYEVTIPWLIGHFANRDLGILSFSSAVAFGVMGWGLRGKSWGRWLVFGLILFLSLAFWWAGRFILAGGLVCLALGFIGAEGKEQDSLLLLAAFLTALALR